MRSTNSKTSEPDMVDKKLSLASRKLIVIGAGFRGLACGIELALRGAKVTILESYSETKKQGACLVAQSESTKASHSVCNAGDAIQIPANGTRFMARWGNVLSNIVAGPACPGMMTIVTQNANVPLNQELHTSFDGYPNLYCHRGSVHKQMLNYALSLGVEIGKDTHAILTTNKAANAVICFVTHKDFSDISEDWHVKGEVQDMLACVQGWDEKLGHIIEKIPSNSHPHLATSGTGATQAIEDAACIVALLQNTSPQMGFPLVFRAYQRLSLTQKMGWETRHVWYQTDWETVAANPSMLKFPQPVWLLGSDASEYAEKNFEAVKLHLQNGTPFTTTNVPPGHVHKDWTIEEMLSYEGRAAAKEFYHTRN
ncbi:hypothetical protein FANTH_10148 [Fusarium anthophilum]|uniref:FAD dependent oxidoreductase domain-containing protein n=1 Tax=Fusarium anthophilum TaxID=48485 RepID=A0A8H5DWW7_9HYPO|nr:hypothetical protein FANTH_10148 [Fusarium anthophilum]